MSARPRVDRYLAVAICAVVLQLIFFKLLYPFASYFFTDSFSYIYAAVANQDVATWPIGYSKFLRVFNTFIKSDTGLVCFQYLCLQSAGLYFFYTIRTLFGPRPLVSVVLFCLLVFNPLFLLLANTVSSDALFVSASFCWLSMLLRMIRCPAVRLLWLHALLLAVIFTLRYNAVWYPLAGALAIGLSQYLRWQKAAGMLAPLVLIGWFVAGTIHVSASTTGTRIFSAFGGWQLANNALYADGHISPADRRSGGSVPPRFREIDNVVNRYFDTAHERNLYDAEYPGIYYLWSPGSPLMEYTSEHKKDTAAGLWYKSWVASGALFGDYGQWLIKRYPGEYFHWFLLPNLSRFAIPPMEFLATYNCGMDTVDPIAQHWFGYRTNKVAAWSKSVQLWVSGPFQWLNLIIYLFFLPLTALFLTSRGARGLDPVFTRSVILAGVLWMLHFLFSVAAAPVVLRYQLFPMLVAGCFDLLIVQRLLGWDAHRPAVTNINYENNDQDSGGMRVLPGISLRIRG